MNDLGPVVPIATPVKLNGELDLPGLRSLMQEMIDAGAAGIFVAGSTGRGPWFNQIDRARICAAAADYLNGSVPLLAGCMASGVPGMVENARVMADNGATIAIATVPGYFHYNQTEVEKIYIDFADQSPLPVIVYDIPEFTNVQFSNDLVLRLAAHGNIIGFKDSSADFKRFKSLVEALSDYPDYYLMQGKENLIADSLRLGASGFIVSMIHLDPRPFVEIYRAIKRGDIERAMLVQESINQAMKMLRGSIEQRPESSTLFHFLNIALKERGVCENVLLSHDDAAPDWVIENARKAIQLCANAL